MNFLNRATEEDKSLYFMSVNPYNSEICCTFVIRKAKGDKTMARPIAETPILTGEDAIRFERLRKEVDNLSQEQRAENSRKLRKAVEKAKERITICI